MCTCMSTCMCNFAFETERSSSPMHMHMHMHMHTDMDMHVHMHMPSRRPRDGSARGSVAASVAVKPCPPAVEICTCGGESNSTNTFRTVRIRS